MFLGSNVLYIKFMSIVYLLIQPRKLVYMNCFLRDFIEAKRFIVDSKSIFSARFRSVNSNANPDGRSFVIVKIKNYELFY